MKRLKGLFLCLVSIMAINTHADTLIMELNLDGTDYYDVKGDVLTGSESLIKGSFTIYGTLEGQNLNVGQAIPATQAPNTTQMIIKDKNTVQIIDADNGISGDVRAKVKKSVFGSIKSIDINSDSYLALMRPVLEQSGFDFLSQLNIANDELSVSSNITVSNTECEKDGDDMACDSNVKIVIQISDEV